MLVNYNLSTSYKGYSNPNFYIDEPDLCPICKNAIKPVHLFSNIHDYDNKNTPKLSIVFFCRKCYNTFIAQYSNEVNITKPYKFTQLDYLAPNKFIEEKFELCINDISPSFVKIYNQAFSAEHYGLDEIAGIGYRKALEFLIKDFLISEYPDKETSIKNTVLGNCINNFIESTQLKTVASRATWLGNDQTHYVQKFKDKDISDLKRLIKLSVNWITMISLTHEAENIEKPN